MISTKISLADTSQDNIPWADSQSAPLSFMVPQVLAPAVMTKAEDLIPQEAGYDHNMIWKAAETITDNLVQTYPPASGGQVGFAITRTDQGTSSQISVAGLIYKGMFIAGPDDNANALKRVHLMAYLLKKYASELSTVPVVIAASPAEAPQSPTPATGLPPVVVTQMSAPTTPPGPVLSGDLDQYMELIRSQLAAGKYDVALATIDALKADVADKAKSADTPSK
jgi:hypothetical protein